MIFGQKQFMKTTTFFQIYLDGNIPVRLKAILGTSRVEFFKGLIKACLDIFQDICYARKLSKNYCFACFLKNEGFLKIISNHKKKNPPKQIMVIKQYLLIYLRDLVLKFSIPKIFYTTTNICPVSVDGHNFLMNQTYENYNCIMILLQLLMDLITTSSRSMICSISMVPNRPGCCLCK